MPTIVPNKFKKLTWLIVLVHNMWQSLIGEHHTMLHRQHVFVWKAMYAVFHSNFDAYIVCWHFKSYELLGFVLTDCWDN